jgi:hypothetical protein
MTKDEFDLMMDQSFEHKSTKKERLMTIQVVAWSKHLLP